jgi:hypothetical protein
MRRADAFQHVSEEETGPAALPNSNGDTSLATYASLATGIPSEQQQGIATISPEEINEAWTKLHEQGVARLKALNMQAGRPQMHTQTDSQMRYSLSELSFPAYLPKDDTVRGVDDLLDFLQIPTHPVDFLEERNTVSAIMRNLRRRHCSGLLYPAEAKALKSALKHKYNSPYSDRKGNAYWAVTAIYQFMDETRKGHSSYEFTAIDILRAEYSKFLAWMTSSETRFLNITAPGNRIVSRPPDEF